MNRLEIKTSLVENTIFELQRGGRDNCERVLLWLGSQAVDEKIVEEIYVPEQYAEADFFRIPRPSMAKLMRYLRKTNQRILAQVHSHPEEAFHSLADDRWAIIRHKGALSLVLPRFALETGTMSFISDIAVFELSPLNEWIKVPKDAIKNYLSVK